MKGIPVLNLRDVSLAFGDKVLFSDLALDVGKFDKIALIGHNGCGKSTLLKVLANLLTPDTGERYEEPGLTLAYVPQEPAFQNKNQTVDAYLNQHLDNPLFFYKAERYALDLGVDLTKTLGVLSGGEGRRVELTKALMQEPDILLLDEPTNHLDLSIIQWLEDTLNDFRGAFVVISHDRTFLNNVTNMVLWLDRGKIHTLDKGFQYFDAWQEDIINQEIKQSQRLGKILEKEQRWLQRGVTARRKRNQGRLRRLHDLRAQKSMLLRPPSSNSWELPKELNMSKVIIEAFDISKSYGDHILVHKFSTRILKGDRIGIIGPNGCGKTTLLKMLTNNLKPDSGTLRFGKKLDVVYMDQHRTPLKPEKSLKEILCPNGGDYIKVGETQRHVAAYLKDFLFDPKQAQALVSTLSGGERNRLLLAKSLAEPASVLVLDEPTNDLDMDTLDKLQELLDSFQGTLLMVSHDRDFLDKTASSIIAFENDGSLSEHVGGYSDYLTKRPLFLDHTNKKVKIEKKQKATSETRKSPKEKLSFKHTYRLDTIPKELKKIDEQLTELESILANPTFYSQETQKFHECTQKLSDLKTLKENLENEWLELASLKENIENR